MNPIIDDHAILVAILEALTCDACMGSGTVKYLLGETIHTKWCDCRDNLSRILDELK